MLEVDRLKSINFQYISCELCDNSVLRAFFEMIFEMQCFVIHSTAVGKKENYAKYNTFSNHLKPLSQSQF